MDKNYLVTLSSVSQYSVKAKSEEHAQELIIYHGKGKLLVEKEYIDIEEETQDGL